MVRSFDAQITSTSEWNLGKERQTAGPGSFKSLSGCVMHVMALLWSWHAINFSIILKYKE